MGNLQTILKWRTVRALALWNRLPIRAQGGIVVLIPLVAVLISFGFAIWGNLSREARQTDIQRKFRAVRQYGDLLTLLINAETGERGFVLTRRDEYLQPYQIAVAEIPKTVAALKETIAAEPGDKPRLEKSEKLAEVEDLILRQLAHLRESQNFMREAKSEAALVEHLQRGKQTMDEIRARLDALQNTEEILLAERLEEINSIRQRDYIVIFVVLLLGILVRVVSFYLFDRGIVRRVNRLTDYADSILRGDEAKYVCSEKTDAVGLLENKVVQLAEKVETDAAIK